MSFSMKVCNRKRNFVGHYTSLMSFHSKEGKRKGHGYFITVLIYENIKIMLHNKGFPLLLESVFHINGGEDDGR